MNILFDLVAAQPEKNMKYHGGSEYAKAVFIAVAQLASGRLFCIYDAGRDLDTEIKSCCQDRKIPLLDINQYTKLDQVLEKYNIGLFYSALPLEKTIQQMLPFNEKVKSIITIHGLRSLELLSDNYELKYSTGFYFKLKYFYKRIFPVKYKAGLLLRMRLLIKNYYNPIIVTVSDYSRLSLGYFMPKIPEESIHVLYSPINDYLQKSNDDSFLLKNKLESKKYFLLLSAGIWQKNSFRMLSAFHNLIKKDQAKEYKVVIIGASQKIKKEFTQNSFIYLDYLDRSDLEVLLKNAHSLVYPSLNEGFGYPPLEAFKYGTGVIASAIGPVLEVCGNAALYFNPYSLTEIELRLLQSINDPDFITETQPRIDRFLMIRQRQINDLNALSNLICN
jgi:glycosyltransferase involved in cell wall biosynthesis